jgi:hypothetical protein
MSLLNKKIIIRKKVDTNTSVAIKEDKSKDSDEWYGIFYDCPSCDKGIMEGSNYCQNCGKKINWIN